MMLYDAYEVQRSFLAGASKLAGLGAGWLTNPVNPLAYVSTSPLIAAYLLDSTRSNYSPEFLAQAFLEAEPATDIPDGFSETAYKTTERADWINQLGPILRSRIVEADLTKVYDEIEIPVEAVIADIEMTGMKVDGAKLKAL